MRILFMLPVRTFFVEFRESEVNVSDFNISTFFPLPSIRQQAAWNGIATLHTEHGFIDLLL